MYGLREEMSMATPHNRHPVQAAPSGVRRRYDWERIRAIYVEGTVNDKGERSYPTLNQVAEMEGIMPSRVRTAAARGEWKMARAAFQSHVEKVRQQKRAHDLAKEAVHADEQALKVSKLGVQLVQMRIGEIAQDAAKRAQAKKRYDDLKAAGGSPEDLDDTGFDPWAPPAVDAREIASLAQAANAWHTLASKALGEPETLRHEITGPSGGPLDIRSSIRAEMVRDEPARLHALLVAVERAHIGSGSAAQLESAEPRPDQGDEP